MPDTVEELISKQEELFGLISRARSNLEKLEIRKRTPLHGRTRVESLDSHWKKFQAVHDRLGSLGSEERKKLAYFQGEFYFQCEETYCDNKAEMLQLIEAWKPREENTSTANDSIRTAPQSRQLPRINLPKFSGSPNEWSEFCDLFSTMIGSNEDLSAVEKLQYLKMSLTGEAALLLKNITVTENNFARAWQTLVSRYQNKRVLIDSYLASLLSARRVTNESATDLKALLNETNDSLEALATLGSPVKSWDHIIVYLTVRKLDAESVKAWELAIGAETEPATLEKLEQLLLSRVRALEAVDRHAGPQKSKQAALTPGSSTSKAKVHQANIGNVNASTSEKVKNTTTCAICQAAHYISACPDYRSKSAEKRREIVVQKGLCFNCLGPHQYRNCRSAKRCQVCAGPHHTTIHLQGTSSSTKSTVGTSAPTMTHSSSASASAISDENVHEASVSSNVALSRPLQRTTTMLATVLVRLTTRHGFEIEVRALLDQGSEVSFVSESLAYKLNYPRHRTFLPISGIGGKHASVCRQFVSLNLKSRTNPAFSLPVDAFILRKLTSYTPPVRSPTTAWSHLNGLELADPEFATSKSIDLVLGAGVYAAILEDGIIRGDSDSPIAQKTAFGWVVSGPVISPVESKSQPPRAYGLQCSADHELKDLLQRFWVQEETTKPRKVALSREDSQCEQHFVETHSRESDGRYVVRLPLKQSPRDLGNSRQPAVFALSRQESRFVKDPNLKQAYSEFLSEYESLAHMKRVAQSEQEPRRVFYLPHHAVICESSSTTRVRVVFNGSHKTNLGISINDLQFTGPKLQLDLADVISRWRLYACVFVADIQKMYRQIRVHPDDWDLQRILWRKNSSEPLSSFRLCTVTYGLTSAPYLALRVLRQLALDEREQYPRAQDIIEREIYVDDVLSGADGISDAEEKVMQIRDCLKAGGFALQKWASNDEDLLSNLPSDEKEKGRTVSIEDDSPLRTLGILWQPRADVFLFSPPQFKKSSKLTKRCILAKVAQLFDPLGWIAPVVIRGKAFLQELWKLKLGWDAPVPKAIGQKWMNFEKELDDLSLVSVPRWLGVRANESVLELHGFSDASKLALGAVIYLRVFSDFDDICITIVSAKTRVAPLKNLTIPRLELAAALLLSRQIAQVREALNLSDVRAYLWTDSTVTLAYLKGDVHRWSEFVQNRVTEINEIENTRWHHVPGKENPADLASRGVSPSQLATSELWWKGPKWLSKPSTFWPSITPPVAPDVALEIRKTHANLATEEASTKIWDLVERFSSLTTLFRITAWIFRASDRFRNKKNNDDLHFSLTPLELEKARLFWVKTIQQAYFETEIRSLQKNKPISRTSQLIRLTPFIDDAGLVRVGGRLQHSFYAHDEKHPLILPKDSNLTTLIIDHAHRSTLHGGTQVTLSTLRRQYWIVGGRAPIRSLLSRCVVCARHRATLGQQLMGQLPPSRLIRTRPFIHAGVDLAGPVTLRTFRGRGAKTYKGYIVVFICFSTSAVHVELATEYTTEAFLASFKRFTGRRGLCKTITSDCGTNLLGAAAELQRLFDASSKEFAHLANVLANDGVTWKFNPPSAPHFGGKWEAAVKSVKFHLKRVIGDTGLTYEEYSTFLIQVEAVLNSRPLCALSDDPSHLTALTPGHFLVGTVLNVIPEPALIDLPQSRLSRWQLLRQPLEHFWSRWKLEYIQQLQVTSKWQTQTDNIKTGALVLVKDERYPPSKWPLGRVTEVHPGGDGLVRVVTVRTQTSTLKRPIVKLCILPTANVTESD